MEESSTNNKEKPRVLITGCTGFIGSAVARAMVKDGGYRVAGLIRTASNESRLHIISDIIPHIELYRANFTDYYALHKAVTAFSPEYVLHIGAQTAVRESFELLHEFNETNYLGTINLIHACLDVPHFKKFIFASTMEVYGWQKSRISFDEKMKLHPASPYAVSKAACESYIEMAGHAYGLPYLIARCCNTYGRHHNTGFIVEYIITSMLAKKDIFIGTPMFVRDLMYLEDQVSAYMALLKSDIKNDVFNFGTGSKTNMMGLANKLKRMLKYHGKITKTWPPNYPLRPVVEEYLSINASKAKKVLGWSPKYSLEEGLKKTIAYWKNFNGEK